MSSLDKDFRYMALNDLKNSLEAQKNSVLSYDSSVSSLIDKVLTLLKDNNGEVQNMAINWYR